jgi:retron-type reverse transcriptase
VYIPEGHGKEKRPVGIPRPGDDVVQGAVLLTLERVYMQDFPDCSYGFRAYRSAHQALEALRNQLIKTGGAWVLQVGIKKYFDIANHEHLKEMLRKKIRDRVLL